MKSKIFEAITIIIIIFNTILMGFHHKGNSDDGIYLIIKYIEKI